MVYGEGLYLGYRHYERARIAPLFPFGHGLSYTAFEYGRPSLSRGGKLVAPSSSAAGAPPPPELVFAVSNVGGFGGFETAQMYVRRGGDDNKKARRLSRPEKELVAFEKVWLQAGETKHVGIVLDKYAVGYYDTLGRRRVGGRGGEVRGPRWRFVD